MTPEQIQKWDAYLASLKRSQNRSELDAKYRDFAAYWREKHGCDPDYEIFQVAFQMGIHHLSQKF